jgi:hypothetical protein
MLSYSRNSSPLMEPEEGLIPFLEESAAGPYPGPN